MNTPNELSAARYKVLALVLISLAATAAVIFLVPPVAQDPGYHRFADQKRILGVPNFWNTVTNLPFLLIGVVGFLICLKRLPDGKPGTLRPVYMTFFASVILIAFGSAYYHLDPSSATLLWDRLPMSIAFMALLAVVVGECVSPPWGLLLLVPLLIAGLASVIHWAVSENRGLGDLRFYVLVQFLPLVLIPLILLMFGSARMRSGYLWAILVTYAVAKVAEHFDAALLEATGVLSGHSIKHLLSGLATFWMLPALIGRRFGGGR